MSQCDPGYEQCDEYCAAISRLAAERDALRKDAERYRWCRNRLLVTAVRCRDEEIRMMPLGIASVSTEDYAVEVDAAIDEEIAASETASGSEP